MKHRTAPAPPVEDTPLGQSFFGFSRSDLLLSGRIGQFWNRAAGDRPEIQAGNSSIRSIAFLIALKLCSVDLSVTVKHSHPPPNSKISKTHNIRSLHTKCQNHFRCPHTHTFELRQFPDNFLIAQTPELFQIQSTALHLLRKIQNVICFFVGHSNLLKPVTPLRSQ